jgi:hypothetical protein
MQRVGELEALGTELERGLDLVCIFDNDPG